jgi:hypothetical protein
VALAVGAGATAPPLATYLFARTQPGWRSPPVFDGRFGDVGGFLEAFARWFVPGRPAPVVVAAVTMLLVAGLVAAVAAVGAPRTHHPAPIAPGRPTIRAPWQPTYRSGPARRGALVTLGVYAVVYLVVVVLSGLFVDHLIPFDARLALPLLPAVAAVLAAGADAAVGRPAQAHIRMAVAVAVVVPAVVVVAVNAQHSRQEVWSRQVAGVWTPARRSLVLDAVRALPPEQVVVTNQSSAIHALTDRPAIALPLRTSPQTGAANPQAGRDTDQLVALLRERRAVVVIDRAAAFEQSMTGRPLVTDEQLRARVPLTQLAADDGFILLGPS